MNSHRPLIARPGVPNATAAAVAFVVLTIVSTWPLAANLGGHIRGYNDPFLFAWMLGWVSNTIFSDPTALFQTNVFWPYGNTLAWSEPLIFPGALIGAPALALSDNPIFSYNVTQIFFQSLSGWCAWYATRRLTGSDAGAVLAGIVFALSPFKTGYYQYLNIHLSFAVPLAIMFWYQFLVEQRMRHLVLTCLLVWLQALSIWYGAIPLALMLLVMTVCFIAMRPGKWTFKFILLCALAAVLVGLAVWPVAAPYFQTRDELGFVRSLAEINKFRADVLSFFDAGRWHYFHQWIDSGREPGIMAGAVTYLLAMAAVIAGARHWLTKPSLLQVFRRGIAVLGVVLLALLIAALIFDRPANDFPVDADDIVVGIIIVTLGLMLSEGYNYLRNGEAEDRRLDKGSLILLLSFLTLLAVGLTLGPQIHVGGEFVDDSPYVWLYDYVPGFKGLRIAFRLAFVFLFLVGLLAAFALAAWSRRRAGWTRNLSWLAPVIVFAEFAHTPLEFLDIDWTDPPAAYSWLKQQPDNDALLELPTFNENIDSVYSFWSLYHERPIVNGVSGFPSPLITGLAPLIRRLPSERDLTLLREIDRLRYLKINLEWIKDPELKNAWLDFANETPPGISFVDQFDSSLLFQLENFREPGTRWRRFFAAREAQAGSAMKVIVDLPDFDPEISQFVDLSIDSKLIDRKTLTAARTELDIVLPQQLPQTMPLAVELQQRYEIRPAANDTRYQIGSTGIVLNADLVVESGHATAGDVATITLNGVNVSPRQAGYNLVSIDPQTGEVLRRNAFDIDKRPATKQRLVKFIDSVPPGMLVAVAMRRRGTTAVDTNVFNAFKTLGASNQVNGTRSHLIVGIKGAASGTAIEQIDRRKVRATVGQDRNNMAMIVTRIKSK